MSIHEKIEQVRRSPLEVMEKKLLQSNFPVVVQWNVLSDAWVTAN